MPSPEVVLNRQHLTYRDCPSKLPWSRMEGDEYLNLEDSDDEDHLKLKTVTMTQDAVKADQHLQDQFSEGTRLWTDEDVIQMHEHVREKGVEWWLTEYVIRRQISPRKLLLAFGLIFSKEMPDPGEDKLLRILKMTLSRIVKRRERLTTYNTISDVATLIRKSQRILVLSGAGISVSSGIPDFRSENGLYQMLRSRYEFELDDPQQMFDLQYFKEKPHVFYSFAKEIYPANNIPSISHRFIKLLEDKQKLLRNYTQNIDDLESSVGIQNVLQCHGSFSRATCVQCGKQYPGHFIENDVLAQRVPYCKLCPPPVKVAKKRKRKNDCWDDDDESDSDVDMQKAILKPNITFFGEKLTDKFEKLLRVDRESVDLLIVIGTSLKVSPVSEILSHIPHSVPQILINKTPIKHMNADVVLLGNADTIVYYLCTAVLGWDLPTPNMTESRPSIAERRSSEVSEKKASAGPRHVADSHVWLFDGAEGGDFVEKLAPSKVAVENDDTSVGMSQAKKARVG